MATVQADEFLTELQSKVDCYRKLARLVELQHDHVQNGREDELIEVLDRRTQILTAIGITDQTVVPVLREWPSYATGLEADQRSRAEQLLAEYKRLAEQINAADRDDVLVLQQRKLNLGHQIDRTTSAKQVNRAYANAAYGRGTGSRMDLQR
jgi:hypothetical protein